MVKEVKAYNIFELREMAKRRVPRGLFDFVDRGTEDEISLRNNRAVFDRIRFKPRALVDVSKRTLATTIFGVEHKMPLAISPTGTAGLMWYEGELELAKAARAAGIPFTLATGSLTAMEKVADEAGGELWFQLYMWADRAMSHELVERARSAGYKALVVTVDSAASGNREYNVRTGFTVPFTFSRRAMADILMHPRWLVGVMLRYMMTSGMPVYANYPAAARAKLTAGPMGRTSLRTDSLNWDDLAALRKTWPHKLIVKGVMHPEDAVKALDYGADAISLSNHGGRNLDGVISPLEALPDVVSAVGRRAPVLLDGGFRRGSDVVKALALGASMVMIGRPTLYGLAAAGYDGAARALELYHEEIRRVMAFLGVNSVDQLNPEYLKIIDPTLMPSGEAPPNLRLVAGEMGMRDH
ncbi:MAG TPA: alpha-hydroxy acid oxidase [Devosia sp.]|nr:alpha-hydroxy acid oxidase [Devosia sp.]